MATGDTIADLSFAQKLAKESTVDWNVLAKAIENSYRISVEINKTFGQGQERLSELMGAVSDAIPRVARLGGSITDVQDTMKGIAEASRRNVIANTEDVEKLYAATQIIGGSAQELSNSFLDIGVGISEIPKQLEESINYIQSIGGNTKSVMKDVSDNMDEMNRYQFQGGVQGLTKMAAQASMLRFDMNQTFQLADKVLDPENAIEVASAFQRLGVSAGNLADPFQLMNQSINDPSGLQNSLADVAKQFTYFDEKTKTFKINPQGVLTLREMEKQTGVSAKEMSKLGLAAAELDQRLSAVNMAGLNIKEEDKQYLANIAKMGEGGEYEVKLTNEKGDEYTKKLSDITQTEMNKLIEQQKTGPKTLEEIAISQLDIDKATLAQITGLREAFVQGLTSPRQVRQGIAGAQRAAKTVLSETSDAIKAKDFRNLSEGVLNTLGSVAKDLKEGNKPLTDVLSNGLNGLGTTLDSSQKRFTEVLKDVGEKIASKLTNQTVGESVLKSGVNKVVESYGGKTSTSSSPLTSSVGNKMETLQNSLNNPTSQINKNEVNVSGTIKVDLMVPAGVSTQDQQKYFADIINSPQFKDQIVSIVSPNNPTKQPNNNVYV
jgi:uncharacterized protein YukE